MVRIRESVYGVQFGEHFGKWEVIGKPFSIGRHRWKVVVRCACGLIKAVECTSLAWAGSTACHSCSMIGKNLTHGATAGKRRRLHQIWAGMIQRCTNQNCPAWKDYGGRGIEVCQEWRRYEAFRDWSLANGYGDDKEIDRYPDNNSGYRPDNCRWVSRKVNQRNRRNNLVVEAFGVSKCLAEWAEDERCVVSQPTLLNRLTSGWTPEAAITEPCRQHQPYRQKVNQ